MIFPLNGIGLVFVLNLLAWLEFLAVALVVFGCVLGFLYAISYVFSV